MVVSFIRLSCTAQSIDKFLLASKTEIEDWKCKHKLRTIEVLLGMYQFDHL